MAVKDFIQLMNLQDDGTTAREKEEDQYKDYLSQKDHYTRDELLDSIRYSSGIAMLRRVRGGDRS